MQHDPHTAERLAAKVDRRGAGECWPFVGHVAVSGYGRIHTTAGPRNAHRVAWEIHNNCMAPKGLVVRHKCDNRPCCNPEHLEIGTYQDNARDAIERGRFVSINPLGGKSHCKSGHEFTPENIIIQHHNGARGCRQCMRDYHKRRRAKKKLSAE